MAPAPPADSYQILSQSQSEELLPSGTFEHVWTIRYRTAHGVIGYVVVPDAQHDAATVDSAIRAKIADIDEIHRLGTEPVAQPDYGADYSGQLGPGDQTGQ